MAHGNVHMYTGMACIQAAHPRCTHVYLADGCTRLSVLMLPRVSLNRASIACTSHSLITPIHRRTARPHVYMQHEELLHEWLVACIYMSATRAFSKVHKDFMRIHVCPRAPGYGLV